MAVVNKAVVLAVAVSKVAAVAAAFSLCRLIALSESPIGPSVWSMANVIRIRR